MNTRLIPYGYKMENGVLLYQYMKTFSKTMQLESVF